jgi:hypothetical protein
MKNVANCLVNMFPNLLIIGVIFACTAMKTQPQQSSQFRAVYYDFNFYPSDLVVDRYQQKHISFSSNAISKPL